MAFALATAGVSTGRAVVLLFVFCLAAATLAGLTGDGLGSLGVGFAAETSAAVLVFTVVLGTCRDTSVGESAVVGVVGASIDCLRGVFVAT